MPFFNEAVTPFGTGFDLRHQHRKKLIFVESIKRSDFAYPPFIRSSEGQRMGSEGPSVVTVHVTGFKKFHGVSENPTEIIVRNLKGFMQKKGLPEGLVLGSCNVLEAAGEGALPRLYETLQLAVAGQRNETSNRGQIIWLHLGVNSGATRFAIENQAVNEATFRCPDEMGWKPQRVPIVYSDGSIARVRETSLPVNEIVKALSKMGYNITPSDDAGRFMLIFT
ncbi:Pyroglutamyl peptidase [Musa troglodytarum]|uniref:Pyroglutamyl peptidase n=1 Tax=Musa troglodytarum TaxID=320322 RepID=A0A9E7JGW1_9LILI|nr:Pyroglutamyl peptidase [Musa troglodytarum]